MSSIAPSHYKSELAKPVWCPGCGDYGVLTALYRAMAELELDPRKTVLVSGIGCSGRLPYFVKSFAFHSVHGRALPVAMGIKAANPDLTVIVVGGDGDGIGIGGGHLPHIARRNVDITYLLLDNSIYGLTKGQSSPTTPVAQITSSAPFGVKEPPLDPVLLSLSHGASFVARGFSAYAPELGDVIRQGILHRGFSFLQVLSPCPTFNKDVTFDHYKSALQKLPEDFTPDNRARAMALALEPDTLYRGVFYREERPTHHDGLQMARDHARAGGGFAHEELLARFA